MVILKMFLNGLKIAVKEIKNLLQFVIFGTNGFLIILCQNIILHRTKLLTEQLNFILNMASEIIVKLLKDDLFKELYEVGLITPKIFSYFEKYSYVQSRIHKKPFKLVIEDCAEYFDCSIRTVFRSIKFFTNIINS
jgi:hypothetical protein